MKFCFGDIVVVGGDKIGVVVNSWASTEHREAHHYVFVRMYNDICRYNESEMQRYMVRHKYLDDEELEWQRNAIKG